MVRLFGRTRFLSVEFNMFGCNFSSVCWRSLLLALLVLTSGCWSDVAYYDGAVWSDDDQEIAYVLREYQEKNKVGARPTRDHSVSVWRSTHSQPDQKTRVSSSVEGDIIDLYYMRDQGYLILGRGLDRTAVGAGDNPTQNRRIIFEKIDLAQNVTRIGQITGPEILSCDGGQSNSHVTQAMRVIPSPDGTILAKLSSVTDCNNTSLELTFLTASNLSQLGQNYSIDLSRLASSPLHSFMHTLVSWRTDGSLVITGQFWNAPGEGWQIFPQGQAQWLTGIQEECMWTSPTTSGPFRDDGLHVEISNAGQIRFSTEITGTGFNCGN